MFEGLLDATRTESNVVVAVGKMGEPFIAGHYVSGIDHDVLFYDGHPNQPCHKMPRGRLPFTVKETLKENISKVTSPEFNLFHMASPDLERLIVGQSVGNTSAKETSTLNSSDLNVLNLVSPDFEKIISSFQAGEENMLREAVHELRDEMNGEETKSVEEQHEMYTKTFVDALQKMHEQQINHREQIMEKNKIETSYRGLTDMNSKQPSRFIFEHHPELFKLHAHVKLSENARDQMESRTRERNSGTHCTEELEMNPAMFPLPPIDLHVQEIVKRERKKQKNRVAASKCRKKKLEREAQLEVTVQQLKERNIELNAVANALRNQVTDLKQRVMEHIACGCQVTSLTMAY